MILLSDEQVDRWVQSRRRLILAGLTLLVCGLSLPNGWTIGVLTGYMLMSFGICLIPTSKWRSESGVWMYATMLVVFLAPCWFFFEYLSFQNLFLQEGGKLAFEFDWKRVRFLLDSLVSLSVLSLIVRFSVSLAIKNWHWTRRQKIYECGVRAGQRIRLKSKLEFHFGDLTEEIPEGTICRVLRGYSTAPGVIWLSHSDGRRLTWYDDPSFFEYFELVD